MVSMHLLSIPAGVGNHDCCHTLYDGGVIGGHVNAQQSMPINNGVVLIDAVSGATITHEVFCTGCYLIPFHKQECLRDREAIIEQQKII